MAHELENVGRYTDAELVCRLESLVKADRELSAQLLVHLGEVDARGVYRDCGYSSMFGYCSRALGMSDAEAYLRIYAARLGREFPLVVERLGSGAMNLTSIKLLGPHLNAENHVLVLGRASGKTTREIEALVAELAPKPDVPARMRKLPDSKQLIEKINSAATAGTDSPDAPALTPTVVALPVAPAAPTAATSAFVLQPPAARASSKPLSPGRFKLEVTLGQEAHDKLEQLRELLRHQNPSGDLTSIVERALSELLERTMQKRFAQTKAPARVMRQRASDQPNVGARSNAHTKGIANARARSLKSRYIPRKVLREVHARDAGQCTFVSPDGRRCAERGFLEVHHHETPYARGGEETSENLRLACRAHNMLMAEQAYGREFMQTKLRNAQLSRSASLNSSQNE